MCRHAFASLFIKHACSLLTQQYLAVPVSVRSTGHVGPLLCALGCSNVGSLQRTCLTVTVYKCGVGVFVT